MSDTGPPRKRQRQEVNKRRHEARLFVPFRALGLVTNHIPFVLQTRSFKGASDGPRIHILTCLGKSWAIWEGGKMNLLFVGELLFYLFVRESVCLSSRKVPIHISKYLAWLWMAMQYGLLPELMQ